MQSKAVRILAIVALIEAVIIVALVLRRSPFDFHILPVISNGKPYLIKTQVAPVRQDPSPLALALQYDAPDKKFEEVVKANLPWLPYRAYGDPTSILATCAFLKRTNYVRILIENGDGVEQALQQLTALNDDQAKQLLKQVELEVRQTGTTAIP